MSKKLQDLYTDFLICTSGLATATGLSAIVDNEISHDKISRFLTKLNGNRKELWHEVKPLVRQMEQSESCNLIIDDTIEEKPYSDINEIVNYYYSHSKHMQVKGINILSAIAGFSKVAIPIDYHIVKKTEEVIDPKTGKARIVSEVSKNEVARDFIFQALRNKVNFKYVLADIWFSSSENMEYIHRMNRKFIFGCKTNRMVKFDKVWHKLRDLPLADEQVIYCYIKDVNFPVAITKKVFTNADLSTGEIYLISNDLELSGSDLYSVYQKRWVIEEYHKSIKQNAALAKSPTKVIKTQSNHIYCSILAFVKLEKLKIASTLNHFALKTKLFINATKSAMAELTKFKLMPNLAQNSLC